MQAITTKYHGPTDTRGSRISARCDAGRITVSYNYALGIEDNHRAAAQALRIKLGWTEENYGPIVGGSLPTGDGYAFVFTGSAS